MRSMSRGAIACLAATALVAGCGSDDSEEPAREPAPAQEAPTAEKPKPEKRAAKGSVLKAGDSQFGTVLLDRRGEALYLFAKEKSGKSECYGACAKAWPPLLTKGEPRAVSGAKKSLLGTTKRRDGKLQVTYRGQPLYYYEHDEPGRILCHNVPEFGGLWLVVRPNGRPAPA